ncbi:MAG TPA: OmpA family protein [Rhodanobacteraceae bacterium]|nr:OmpA family protein [Rhodanobacteraceae bacterium]
MTRTIEESRYARWTWTVALLLVGLLIVLWLIGKGPSSACCGTESATTATQEIPPALAPPPPMQSAAKTPGSFAVTLDGDKRTLEGQLADAPGKERVMQAAIAAFGETNVVDRLVVEAAVAPSICAQKAETLFAALKTDPPIGIACDANGAITLTGSAQSDADKSARERWAHEFFSADTAVTNRIQVAAAAQPVARPEDVRCAARMPAAVTFATASSRIDARGRKLLDAIEPCLKDGRYEIAGYTDSIGTAEANMTLSKARAESVRAYMILKGVDADRLVANGYGADRAIGDNATREGRASNRRIEFVRK